MSRRVYCHAWHEFCYFFRSSPPLHVRTMWFSLRSEHPSRIAIFPILEWIFCYYCWCVRLRVRTKIESIGSGALHHFIILPMAQKPNRGQRKNQLPLLCNGKCRGYGKRKKNSEIAVQLNSAPFKPFKFPILIKIDVGNNCYAARLMQNLLL